MVNRNVRVRTARRQKVWAVQDTPTLQLLSTGSPPLEIAANLLASFKTDMGLAKPPAGVTCMRIVGHISCAVDSTATVNSPFRVAWGIAWLPGQVALAGTGDAQIPDPEEEGTREAPWIQRGMLRGQSIANPGTDQLLSAQGQLEAFVHLDITQMRKQPSADYELCLVTLNSGTADQDIGIFYQFQTMLALP